MDQSQSHSARKIKGSIQADAAEGGMSLISFANRYAATKKLQHDALILKLNYSKAESEEHRSSMRREMLELVDEIVKDNESYATSEEAKRLEQAFQRAQEHYRRVALPRDAVFGCEGLGKTYRKSGFSLHDLSLSLRLGEITAVVGENANGKTTLFRLVVGDLRHDTGSMAFPLVGQSTEQEID